MPQDTEKIYEVGELAWNKIKEMKLFPTPENFHVWYAYYENKSPDIEHAIDILEKNDGDIVNKDILIIYRRFLDNRRKDNVVQKAGSQVYETVLDLSTKIQDVNILNEQRGERLSEVTGKMTDQDTPGELKEIIDNVVVDTQEILKDNRLLAEELDRSKNAMVAMQQDLENIKKEAATDSLTGLLNRKSFDELLESSAQEAQERSETFALLMVDIDHFKKFNDTYGHQIGDQVLKLVAATLKNGVKGGDIVARYGGEEFCLILPRTKKEDAAIVAEHLRANVSSKDVINRGTGKVLGQIRLSAGIAEYQVGEKLEDIIEAADKALYEAKNTGRDKVCISDR